MRIPLGPFCWCSNLHFHVNGASSLSSLLVQIDSLSSRLSPAGHSSSIALGAGRPSPLRVRSFLRHVLDLARAPPASLTAPLHRSSSLRTSRPLLARLLPSPSLSSLSLPSLAMSQSVCVDFTKGRCFRDNCKYTHAAGGAPSGASGAYGQSAYSAAATAPSAYGQTHTTHQTLHHTMFLLDTHIRVDRFSCCVCLRPR